MNILVTVFAVVLGLAIGVAVGYAARRVLSQSKINTAELRAEKILQDAKVKEQELLLQAKEKSLAMQEENKRDLERERIDVKDAQNRITERERSMDKTLLDVENRRAKIDHDQAEVEQNRAYVAELAVAAEAKLESVAGLTKDAAVQVLMDRVEADSKDATMSRLRKLDDMGDEEIEAKARKILSLAIQRFASSHVVDATVSYVQLTSDDMKGRIIGKEGRNIKALEHLTGCEFIIDDTPESITISGFSPVRRLVAKHALEMLLKDGRIQPAKIEDAVNEAKKDLAKEMRKAGEDALYELGIPVSSIDPKLVAILGRLKFRTSYGQNVLQHCIEVARISGMIAEELGMDAFACKKGGLFHDIGKAVDHDMQGAHPQIGYNIMKKFGFPEEMCYQSIAHHEDRPRTIEGTIVKAADAISGARPGARRNSVEEYIRRLEGLETAAMSFEGVEKAYAIQAGREVRVFVEPSKIDDYAATQLAKDVAKKIESELQYPGEVRVTIIRETRVIEYAR
ncbi:MAG: ribonuclease Y [Patescibacteria group bacterium]